MPTDRLVHALRRLYITGQRAPSRAIFQGPSRLFNPFPSAVTKAQIVIDHACTQHNSIIGRSPFASERGHALLRKSGRTDLRRAGAVFIDYAKIERLYVLCPRPRAAKTLCVLDGSALRIRRFAQAQAVVRRALFALDCQSRIAAARAAYRVACARIRCDRNRSLRSCVRHSDRFAALFRRCPRGRFLCGRACRAARSSGRIRALADIHSPVSSSTEAPCAGDRPYWLPAPQDLLLRNPVFGGMQSTPCSTVGRPSAARTARQRGRLK